MIFGKTKYHSVRRFQPVTEAYQGKNKFLLVAEKEIQTIKDKVAIDPDYIKKAHRHIKVIEDNIAKALNLKDVTLNIYFVSLLAGASINAYTVTNGFCRLADTKFSRDLGVVQDFDSTKIRAGVNVHSFLFYNDDLTAGEVLAVILHEIGHNLYLFSSIGWVRFILNPIGVIITSIISSVHSDTSQAINQWVDRYVPFIGNALNIGLKLHKSLAFYYNLFTGALSGGTNPFHYLMHMLEYPGFLVDYTTRYHEEKYADAVANKYGYGPELATALVKIESIVVDGSTKNEHFPLLVYAQDYYQISIILTLSFFDAHPKNVVRIRDMITSLKESLKDNTIDSRHRVMVREDIEELERHLSNLEALTANGKHRIFTKIMNDIIDKHLGGIGDFRDIFIKAPKL